MVDIQCPTAEIRRGNKKEEERRNHRMKVYMSASCYARGHKKR